MYLPDTFLFIFALLISGTLIFLFMYYLVIISDLECDYMNAQQCCTKLNEWVPTRTLAHGFVTCFLLLHGHWVLSILNLPMLIWMVYEMATVAQGCSGVYDPIEICQRGQIGKHMKMFTFYSGYFLLWLFAYLYLTLTSLLQGDPINRNWEEEIDF